MNDEQFTLAVKRYMDTVYRVALNYLREDAGAQDVSQEVFLRLYRSRTDFDSEDHLKYWLLRVTINECKRSLRAPWRRTESLEALEKQAPARDSGPDETLSLVMSLPTGYRVVLYLYYYEGYSTAELAQLLRLPPSTVRSRLARGRALLKTRLKEAEHV